MQQEREKHMNELMKAKDNYMSELTNEREKNSEEVKEN